MRENLTVVCLQQRHRPGCASAQSDQHLIIHFLVRLMTSHALHKFSKLGFLVTRLIIGFSMVGDNFFSSPEPKAQVELL